MERARPRPQLVSTRFVADISAVLPVLAAPREPLSLSLPPSLPLSPDRAPVPTNHRVHPIRVPKRALAVFHVRVVVLAVVLVVSTWPLVQRASNGAPLSPVP